jgi:hypothetical protein
VSDLSSNRAASRTVSGATRVEQPQSEGASRKTRPEKVPGQARHAGHPGLGSDAVIRRPERPRMLSAGSDPIDHTAQPRMLALDRTARTSRRCATCRRSVGDQRRPVLLGCGDPERVARWPGHLNPVQPVRRNRNTEPRITSITAPSVSRYHRVGPIWIRPLSGRPIFGRSRIGLTSR